MDPEDLSLFSFAALTLIGLVWTVAAFRRKSSIAELLCLMAYWAMLAAFVAFIFGRPGRNWVIL